MEVVEFQYKVVLALFALCIVMISLHRWEDLPFYILAAVYALVRSRLWRPPEGGVFNVY